MADRAIYRLAARGYLQREHRSVYRVGHRAPTPLGRETGALLACGNGAVLSHFTAARLWKIHPHGESIHVTVARRNAPRYKGIHAHTTRALTAGEIRIVERLPTTSPLRTLRDLARIADERTLHRAVDEAIQLGLVTPKEAIAATGRLAKAADRHTSPAVTRSELERRFRGLIDAAGLPQPRSNVRVHGYEVDFYWPQYDLVVETDGYRWHRTRPKFEHDSAKGAALVAAGLILMRFTWLQVDRQPFVVTAQLAQAMARAEARAA